MKVFFQLGKNKELSAAEIYVFPYFKNILMLECGLLIADCDLSNEELIKLFHTLGGSIKAGVILGFEKQYEKLQESIKARVLEITDQEKIIFGISGYGLKKPFFKLGIEVKKLLNEKGLKARFVTSKEPTLSSVVITQNKVNEFVAMPSNSGYYYGQTLAVQDFKEFSHRDFGRPARDDYSGMLPPKLAMIMLNLAQVDKKKSILDPFCGSGTIITEAMLQGYQNIKGSDISPKAVSDTQENISWFKIDNTIKIIQADAEKIDQYYKDIDAIITEPYLGPSRGDIKVNELNQLYSTFLQAAKKVLTKNGKIIMIWPQVNSIKTNPDIRGYEEIIPTIDYEDNKGRKRKITMDCLLYFRPEQKVKRMIKVLQIKRD